uniref:Ubiquinone-NADH dehydrogenase n=1 Tax=Phaffia rhodozyma TaxID=264483 RepID=A0A1C9U6C1_PHARH|nr:ubiquinone-NADH dehydrogenase [Phaffia rhodozyma]
MRSLSGSIEEGKDHLRGLQDQIKAARQIVLIGGGSVGIEFAGEIASQYPKEKSVTIVHRNPQLLSKSVPAKLAAKLHWQLEAAGIHVVLGTEVDSNIVESGRGRVDLGGGKIIDADLIFNTTGTKTNTSLIAAADANVLDPNGLVKVDAHLRIVPSLDGGFFDGKTYFAIGDCAASLGPQTYFKAKNDATFAAKNILASIFKKSLTAIKAPLDVIVVPIGTTGGAGKVPFGIVGAWPTSLIKGKGLFISNFDSLYLYSASTIVSTIMPILAVTVVITAWWSYHHVGLGRAT